MLTDIWQEVLYYNNYYYSDQGLPLLSCRGGIEGGLDPLQPESGSNYTYLFISRSPFDWRRNVFELDIVFLNFSINMKIQYNFRQEVIYLSPK